MPVCFIWESPPRGLNPYSLCNSHCNLDSLIHTIILILRQLLLFVKYFFFFPLLSLSLCLFPSLDSALLYAGGSLDFQNVLRRISYGAGPLATSSLLVGRFAAKKGSLRAKRGRLVASLGEVVVNVVIICVNE